MGRWSEGWIAAVGWLRIAGVKYKGRVVEVHNWDMTCGRIELYLSRSYQEAYYRVLPSGTTWVCTCLVIGLPKDYPFPNLRTLVYRLAVLSTVRCA